MVGMTRPSDELLARDYLIASAAAVGGYPIHPRQKDNAVDWVRLCSLRATRDPSAWLDDPWRVEIVNAAERVMRNAQ